MAPPGHGLEAPRLSLPSWRPSWPVIISLLSLVLTAVTVGIIGYNFSYYKGSYRKSLFHSELTVLVVFSSLFIGLASGLISSIAVANEPGPPVSYVPHDFVAGVVQSVLALLSSLVLLINLSQYGRYFVEQYETKIFAGALGLFIAGLEGLRAVVLRRSRLPVS